MKSTTLRRKCSITHKPFISWIYCSTYKLCQKKYIGSCHVLGYNLPPIAEVNCGRTSSKAPSEYFWLPNPRNVRIRTIRQIPSRRHLLLVFRTYRINPSRQTTLQSYQYRHELLCTPSELVRLYLCSIERVNNFKLRL